MEFQLKLHIKNIIHYHFTYDSFKGEYKHSYKQRHTESVPPHKFKAAK